MDIFADCTLFLTVDRLGKLWYDGRLIGFGDRIPFSEGEILVSASPLEEGAGRKLSSYHLSVFCGSELTELVDTHEIINFPTSDLKHGFPLITLSGDYEFNYGKHGDEPYSTLEWRRECAGSLNRVLEIFGVDPKVVHHGAEACKPPRAGLAVCRWPVNRFDQWKRRQEFMIWYSEVAGSKTVAALCIPFSATRHDLASCLSCFFDGRSWEPAFLDAIDVGGSQTGAWIADAVNVFEVPSPKDALKVCSKVGGELVELNGRHFLFVRKDWASVAHQLRRLSARHGNASLLAAASVRDVQAFNQFVREVEASSLFTHV